MTSSRARNARKVQQDDDYYRPRKVRKVVPKGANQSDYFDSIDTNTITFGLGPAGTGKTFLAVAKAVAALQAGEVSRIILTRPAVEAGEKLGFLPGTLEEKIDPYLRPLLDALRDIVGVEQLQEWRDEETIEVAPLAFMRGRTLNNSFIILDEAQNTTPEQMKMFLTRLGFGSKMVVTGDSTQTDLPGDSGLLIASSKLVAVEGIGVIQFGSKDVMRHPLISKIVEAYEQ